MRSASLTSFSKPVCIYLLIGTGCPKRQCRGVHFGDVKVRGVVGADVIASGLWFQHLNASDGPPLTVE